MSTPRRISFLTCSAVSSDSGDCLADRLSCGVLCVAPHSSSFRLFSATSVSPPLPEPLRSLRTLQPLRRNYLEGASIIGEGRPLAGVGLPAVDDRVAIDRIVFEEASLAPAGFSCDQRRSRAAEDVEDDFAAA